MATRLLFGLMLNVPVNNFSVMLGGSHPILGITSTLGGKYVLLKETARRPDWGSKQPPTSGSGVRGDKLTTRPPPPPTRLLDFQASVKFSTVTLSRQKWITGVRACGGWGLFCIYLQRQKAVIVRSLPQQMALAGPTLSCHQDIMSCHCQIVGNPLFFV